MNKGLSLNNLCVMRGDAPLIKVDHHINPGQVLTVMGPSGVGKSTLLAFITGTLSAGFRGMGQIELDGADITALPPHKRQVGILFQDDLLFPHMSVGANLIETALSDVGLRGYAGRDPATLSGGQKARVSLVRMLLSKPRALLLDEPFSRLDAELRAQVRDLVFQTARDRQLPVLMVTHDADDAAAAGGDVIELQSLSKP